MTKRRQPERNQSPAKPASDAIHRHMPSSGAIRETIESFAIAFILAFLFRTFEAEAFVIPTGSMAPTLMGRHKDLVCPKCGCEYRASASEEVDPDGAPLRTPPGSPNFFRVVAATCPMCRYTADLAPDNPQHETYPSFNGDRILVSKLAYEFADPRRWSVIVFKFPGDSQTDSRTNFIKRLIGLPGETVRIQHGDILIAHEGEPFHLARKPPERLMAMLQPVFDNDYMPRIAECGWPPRWSPKPSGDGEGQWNSDDFATFHSDGKAAGEHWLRYRHLTPMYEQWHSLARSPQAAPPDLTPQLITDFTAYDTSRQQKDHNPQADEDGLGTHWVGDLAVGCTAELEGSQGALVFELRKGGRQFQCRLDLSTGQAALSISGLEKFRPTAATNVRGPGRHRILFSNCDNELQLWVDGGVVQFDRPTSYEDLGNTSPDERDLEPVGIATDGAAVRLSHLRILRDIYYIAISTNGTRETNMSWHPIRHDAAYTPGRAIPALVLRPSEGPDYVDFRLKADQFFAMGDNSAKSKDGRLWGTDNYWVPRRLLIGEALCIYWPHSWDQIPYIHVPFPFFPNFSRMGIVR